MNGTVGGRSARQKPEASEWRNDSTGSEWKKSVESDWSKDSSKNEWNQDIPVVKEPHHGRNNWNEENIPKVEKTNVEPTKSSDRWTNHAPEHPTKDVDRRNSKQPIVVEPVKPADHWNNQKLEPVKNTDRRNSHLPSKNGDQWSNNVVPEIPKVSDRWNDHPKEVHPKEVAKNGDRWNDHPKETVKNGDRWNDHPKEAVKTADRWNDHPKETVKNGDRWVDANHAKETSKNGDRWNDHAKSTPKNGDQWNDHVIETPKVNDRWNDHPKATVKGSDRYNGHPSDAVKNNNWNGPTETIQEDDDWMMNTSSVDTVKNAETWKNHEPMKNGWSEETIVQEDWVEEPMTDLQLDTMIDEWQEENEQNEWLPEEENFDDELSKPEFPDELDNEPMDDMEPPIIDFKPPVRDSIDYSGNLTVGNLTVGNLTVNGKELDVIRDRRPSVLSIKGVAPSLESSEIIVSELLLPRTDVPELTIDDGDPTMSRAKRRWINAFNKIVAQLNEVSF